MKVSVFSCIKHNRSQDRYAEELACAFTAGTDVRRVWFQQSPGLIGGIRDHFRYLRIARQEQGDINIIVSPSYSFLLRSLDPARTIVVCHDLHPLQDPDIHRPRHRIYTERHRRQLRQMQQAAWIVTVSENTRRELLRFFPRLSPEKVVSIHNGLDPKWKRVTDQHALKAFRRQHGLGDRRIALHVGNDVWYKNVRAFVQAFARFGDTNFTCVHAGTITPSTVTLVAQSGVKDRFVQLHSVDDSELAMLYSIADVFVFPSLSEGFGWPPLEAMACGCPVIAARRASLPEILGEACLYVDPLDIDSIVDVMRRLTANPSLQSELATRGAVQASKFSWTRTAERMLQLFVSR